MCYYLQFGYNGHTIRNAPATDATGWQRNAYCEVITRQFVLHHNPNVRENLPH
jgi:hypothetical protein